MSQIELVGVQVEAGRDLEEVLAEEDREDPMGRYINGWLDIRFCYFSGAVVQIRRGNRDNKE